ncbi:MAG: right-handed parallel beta-helix repeat-containing protein, partial [Planctomycetota bacterium]
MAIPRLGTALAALTAWNTAAQVHVFVDDNAPDGGNGLTWAGALNDLREAVQLAEDLGEFRGEIRIAGGTYLGDLAEPLEIDRYGGQLSGIVLRGGFAGLAMPTASDTRCLSSFPTTLTGFRGIPIAQVNSAAVLTGPRMLGPGPFGALGGVNAARGTVFDGLQFVGTQAIAVSADPDAAVIVRDCKFIDGDSPLGGAINARSVSLLIESSEFTGCEASVLGGAIRHEDGVLIVRDSSFLENTAFLGDGGALFSDSDAVLIERSEFVNNRLLEDFQFGDGGGAVYIERGDVTIEDSVFTGNRAELGGAIYFHAGAVQPLIARSVFDSNNAAAGGAILAEQGATLFVRESLFTRGNALGSGAIDA